MKHSIVLALACALALVGCEKKDASPSGREPAPVEARSIDKAADASAARPGAPSPAKPGPLKVSAPQLAYAYDYAVEAPPASVPLLVRMHEDACAAAGPTVCQVVGADTEQEGHDDVSGRLEVRAAPEWIRSFRSRIEEDVKAAHGKLTGSQVGTEDLSRSIIDTEAALRAKKTLRDRMQSLLATRKAKLDDLVSLEQQVAQIQGEIDAAESELEVMKTRVATSKLVIEYRSTAALAPDSAFGRFGHATHSFLGHTMDGVAALISVLSYLLPFILLIWAGSAVFRWNGKRRKTNTEV